jgi:7-cyano-7-deazaguanine synthase
MAVYVFSGGQDSTVAMVRGLDRGDATACALMISYGQRNSNELRAAASLVEKYSHRFHYRIHSHVLDVDDMARKTWVPYPLIRRFPLDAKVTPKNSTLPGRNALFLSMAAAFTASHPLYGSRVVFGTTAIDAGNADGSAKFIRACASALNTGLPADSRLKFEFPLLRMSKGDVLREAERLGILDDVLHTCVSCHNGDTAKHRWGQGCGKCNACLWRKVGWDEFKGRRPRTLK